MNKDRNQNKDITTVQPEVKNINALSGKPKWLIPVIFGAILAVFFITFTALYPNLPIIERMAETIPGFEEIYPPFRLDENNYYQIARNILDGNFYAANSIERSFPSGFPVAALPFIAVFGKAGGYLANIFIIWLSLLFFYLASRLYLNIFPSIAVTLILAFATPDWFYAVSSYSEPLSQLLIISSLYFMLSSGKSEKKAASMSVSGILAGLNLFVRPHYILLAIPFFLYSAYGREASKTSFAGAYKKGIEDKSYFFGAGILAIIILWIARNWVIFGSPLSFEYSKLAGAFTPGAESGFMKGNIFLGTHMLLFDQYHGLFTITPVLLLFPAGLRSMWLKGLKSESLLLLVSVVMMAVFIASGPYPFTEFGLGSRHMVPILTLLLLPAAFFLNGGLFSRSMVTVTALYSFYMAGIGWFTGGEPGMGAFIGILNESQSKALVLAHKGLIPKREFNSKEQLLQTYLKSLRKADMMTFLQTLNPSVVAKIHGNERTFMLFLRGQQNPLDAVLEADPGSGIIIKDFSIK